MAMDLSPDPSFEHSNWDIIDGRDPTIPACQCFLCADWWSKSDAFKAVELVCETHPGNCRCRECKKLNRHQVRTAMIAAGMRRDIYSELSFLVRNEVFRDEILAWFLNFVKTTTKKDSWFALKAENYTLDYWLQKWSTERSLRKRAKLNKNMV